MDLCARGYGRSRQEEGRGAWIYVQECTKVGKKKEGGHGSMCKSVLKKWARRRKGGMDLCARVRRAWFHN